MATTRDQVLGGVSPAGFDTSPTSITSGEVAGRAFKQFASIGEDLFRANFRQDLRQDLEGELNASQKLQDSLDKISQGDDPESVFDGLDEPTTKALRGAFDDLKKTYGSLQGAVKQGMIPEDLAMARLEQRIRQSMTKFPGLEEDVVAAIRTSGLTIDPRGFTAKRILGLNTREPKKESDELLKFNLDRFKEEDRLAREYGNNMGTDLLVQWQQNGSPAEALPWMTNMMIAANQNISKMKRAEVEANTLKSNNETLAIYSRPLLNTTMELIDSQERAPLMAIANMSREELLKNGPQVLNSFKEGLIKSKATLHERVRGILAHPNRLGDQAYMLDNDALREYTEPRLKMYDDLLQAVEQSVEHPERLQQMALALSNNSNFAASPDFFHTARLMGLRGFPEVISSAEGAPFRTDIIDIMQGGGGVSLASAGAVAGAVAEGMEFFGGYTRRHQEFGDGRAREVFGLWDERAVETNRAKADAALLSNLNLIVTDDANFNAYTATSFFDYIDASADVKGKRRSTKDTLRLYEAFTRPEVLKNMEPEAQKEVKRRLEQGLSNIYGRLMSGYDADGTPVNITTFQSNFHNAANELYQKGSGQPAKQTKFMTMTENGIVPSSDYYFVNPADGRIRLRPEMRATPDMVYKLFPNIEGRMNRAEVNNAVNSMNSALEAFEIQYNNYVVPVNTLYKKLGSIKE